LKPGLADLPTEADCILEIVGKARRINQQFLRHAAANDAGAPHPIFLGDHHARAVARGDARAPHAAGAGADNEKVNVVVGHRATG